MIAGSSWRNDPAAALRGLAKTGSPAAARSSFSGEKAGALHIDLAADLDQLGPALAGERLGYRRKRAEVGGDVLAGDAVAAGRALHETARARSVSPTDSPSILGSAMTSITSSATTASVAVRRKKLRMPAKNSRTSASSKAFSSDSIGTRMGDLGEAGGRRGADPARRAVGADQLGKARLDRRVAPAQRVVVGVGDLGRVASA